MFEKVQTHVSNVIFPLSSQFVHGDKVPVDRTRAEALKCKGNVIPHLEI